MRGEKREGRPNRWSGLYIGLGQVLIKGGDEKK